MKKLFLLLLITILVFTNVGAETFDPPSGVSASSINPSDFVSKWNTSLLSSQSSNYKQIKLPLVYSGTYNFTVDWGDGNSNIITSYNQAEITHSYTSEGVYTVVITGTIDGFQFNNGGDKLKIIDISQWGNLGLGNTGSYFHGCENLVLTATDSPDLSGTTTLSLAFAGCDNLGDTGSLDTWDVSNVTDMSYMFSGSSFNQPVGDWNVSSVINMRYMFSGANNFNQSISNWDVSNVENMGYMFRQASSFNQPIGNWDLSNVFTMDYMFYYALDFNQPLGNWDVSSVENTMYMFHYASSFNQPIGNWDVSRIVYMDKMFTGGALSYQNYDDLLIGWSKLNLIYDVSFDGGYSKYTSKAIAARQYIIDTYRWVIFDDGLIEFTPPYISKPDDISYELGSSNNQIAWNVGDEHPWMYNITLNGVLVITKVWANGSIIFDIYGLEVGIHEYIIFVYDEDGNMASDTVLVTVLDITPPEVSSPDDIFYKLDTTGNLIFWVVGDKDPDLYNITLNGALYESNNWTNGTITLDVDGWAIGEYTLILYLYDTFGNMVSDTVVVTVNKTGWKLISPFNVLLSVFSMGVIMLFRRKSISSQ